MAGPSRRKTTKLITNAPPDNGQSQSLPLIEELIKKVNVIVDEMKADDEDSALLFQQIQNLTQRVDLMQQAAQTTRQADFEHASALLRQLQTASAKLDELIEIRKKRRGAFSPEDK